MILQPSVYRETGRALRGDVSAPANGLSSMIPMEKGRGDGRAATMDAVSTHTCTFVSLNDVFALVK